MFSFHLFAVNFVCRSDSFENSLTKLLYKSRLNHAVHPKRVFSLSFNILALAYLSMKLFGSGIWSFQTPFPFVLAFSLSFSFYFSSFLSDCPKLASSISSAIVWPVIFRSNISTSSCLWYFFKKFEIAYSGAFSEDYLMALMN